MSNFSSGRSNAYADSASDIVVPIQPWQAHDTETLALKLPLWADRNASVVVERLQPHPDLMIALKQYTVADIRVPVNASAPTSRKAQDPFYEYVSVLLMAADERDTTLPSASNAS